jgi:hypothetical protein
MYLIVARLTDAGGSHVDSTDLRSSILRCSRPDDGIEYVYASRRGTTGDLVLFVRQSSQAIAQRSGEALFRRALKTSSELRGWRLTHLRATVAAWGEPVEPASRDVVSNVQMQGPDS